MLLLAGVALSVNAQTHLLFHSAINQHAAVDLPSFWFILFIFCLLFQSIVLQEQSEHAINNELHTIMTVHQSFILTKDAFILSKIY